MFLQNGNFLCKFINIKTEKAYRLSFVSIIQICVKRLNHRMSNYERVDEFLSNKNNIYLKDRNYVLKTIESVRRDGLKQLQIVSDFDWAVTKYETEDGKNYSSYDMIVYSGFTKKDVIDEYNDCEKYYMPFYMNINLNEEIRREKMTEYWEKINQIIIKSEVSKNNLNQIVQNTNVLFRDNANEFFDCLNLNNIPVTIISAGIGNVLMEMFRQKSKTYPNVKIIANFVEFDENDKASKFRGQTIHMFNKKEAILFDIENLEIIKNRSNIILLGDCEGDELIADGLPNVKNILKIGYLNKFDDSKLEKYKNIFDIILINDLTFSVPNFILNYVLNKL